MAVLPIAIALSWPFPASHALSGHAHSGAQRTAQGTGYSGPWRTVRYRGVSLRVPASWPVRSFRRDPSACPRLDVHAVYLGRPGPGSACPADLRGVTETVTLQPVNPRSPSVREATKRTVIGGRAALTNRDWAVTHTIVDVLPAAGVEASLSYGADLPLARQIAATLRIGSGVRAMAPAQVRALVRALARPATIKIAAPQGFFRGRGFDTCAAPSLKAMASWQASPYRAIGIYIGGINRACAQANLTASWIAAIQAMGWHYFPLYPGLQASCVRAYGDATISATNAAAEGTAAAQDAATQAQNLGIPQGTPIIYDMEAYGGNCGSEVLTFLNSWDSELNMLGYGAGVYESFTNIDQLARARSTMTEPSVIDYADWDSRATTWSSYMPGGLWTHHSRIHQYQGGHDETWGGTVINIDNDQLNIILGDSAPAPTP
jgi:Domain of unknown function (DUF1906)